jgi:hypothetical protein
MSHSRLQRRHSLGIVLILLLAMTPSAAVGMSAQPNPGIDPCTRALEEMGTPAALGTPEASANRLAVTQTVMNFASCFNRHNWDGVLALTDPDFRESFLGASTATETRKRLDALDTRGLLPELRIRSIEENGAMGSQFATVAVTWQGWNGLHRELWRLHTNGSSWVLDGRSIEKPTINGAAVGLQLTIGETTLIAPGSEVVNPGTVILAFDNRRTSPVASLVLAVQPDATSTTVLEACNAPGSQLQPVGSVSIEPGSIVYLPLMDLPPGRYAVLAGTDPCMDPQSTTRDQIVMLDVLT